MSNEYYTNFNKEQKSQKLSNYTITRKCFLKFIIIYDDKNRSRNVSSIDEREHARFSKGGILWHEGIKEREKKKEKNKKAMEKSGCSVVATIRERAHHDKKKRRRNDPHKPVGFPERNNVPSLFSWRSNAP